MPHHGENPPVENYDGLPTGEIKHRIKALSPPELDKLLHYEHTHADRPAVTRLIESRRKELRTTDATPTPGGEAPRPGGATPKGTSPVTPDTSPEPFSAPPHGTPHQSGQPKSNRH